MKPPRISASSYSNTAPLIWSFLYGRNHGKVEVILDTAPARSAELLAEDRVDAALVPVIAYQHIKDVRLIPDVCVGARERVRSVCLATNGRELKDVRSVALDSSSQTSAVLSRIIFREFLNADPEWKTTEPDISLMLEDADCALLIGDPALKILRLRPDVRVFDLADVWQHYTGLGFVFAMWMTRRDTCPIDFGAARDEGLEHLSEITANYSSDLPLSVDELKTYLSENISYSIDGSMQKGLELYFRLAAKHGLAPADRPLTYADQNSPD